MRTFLQVVNQLFYPGLIMYNFILPVKLNMYKKVPKNRIINVFEQNLQKLHFRISGIRE